AFTLSSDCSLIAIASGRTITIRSLNGGSVGRTLQFDHDLNTPIAYSGSALIQPGSNSLRFSFNNVWLTQEYYAANPVLDKVHGISLALAQRLAKWLPGDNFVDLVNLETGQTWKRIPAGHGVAFSEDDSRLITFGREGRYIWSVPPRMQLFTPWAWVASA